MKIDINKNIDKYLSNVSYTLNRNYNETFKWIDENIKKYCNVTQAEVKGIVEKIACWYEIRYPDNELLKRTNEYFSSEDGASEIFLGNNYYLKANGINTSNVDWTKLLNKEVFINSLSSNEKMFFKDNYHYGFVYTDSDNDDSACLFLSSDGKILNSRDMDLFSNGKLYDYELVGMSIEEVYELIKSNNIILPSSNTIEKSIDRNSKWLELENKVLDLALLKIINRGGIRYGARRGLLFAKEFDRCIDIPMIYGIDRSDPNIDKFIDSYIEAGGSYDLVCFDNNTSNKIILKDLVNNKK